MSGDWYVSSASAGYCDTTSDTADYHRVTTTSSTGYYYQSSSNWQYIDVGSRQETAEQRREYRRQEAEQRRLNKIAQKEREAAVKKAEELLKEHIGTDAFGKLYEVGHIEVDSQKYKGHKYRIFNDPHRHIHVINDKGEVVDELCIVVREFCPNPDKVLANIVMAKYAEEDMLATANHHRRN